MKISRTERFGRDYRALPPHIRRAADRQIVRLLMDRTHPSLRLEGSRGHKGLFSARVTRRYRMSPQFESDDTVRLRRLLDHDALYRSP